jgi:hypothetical protein
MGAPRSAFERWSLDDIDFAHIEHDLVRDDAVLFHLLCASSFVESDTPLYAANLAAFGAGDGRFTNWLLQHWEREEVRHGQALRRYAEAVWPEYDWEAAYRAFNRDYEPICRVEAFEPTLALEMIGRCVVEVGTATYYGMIASYTAEPVLRHLAARIRSDEVHHYREFLETFQRHRGNSSRLAVLQAIRARMHSIDHEDTIIAERHVLAGLPAGHPFRAVGTEALRQRVTDIVHTHFPVRMGSRMLLRLLRLPTLLQRPLVPAVAAMGRWYMGHVAHVAANRTAQTQAS